MKNYYKLLTLLPLVFTCGCTSAGGAAYDSSKTTIDGFEKNDNVFSKTVASDITTYSFLGKIHTQSDFSYKIFSDVEGTKEIASKTISLDDGKNECYLVVLNNKQENVDFCTIQVNKLALYTVTFNTKGGSEVETQYVEEGSKIKDVNDPSKKGYTFDGWDYDFSKPVTSNLTINAKWTANTYHVTFNSNGGSKVSAMDVQYGRNFSLPSTSKTGYDFDGWYDGSTLVSSGTWSIDHDVELSAHWVGKTYYIFYFYMDGITDVKSVPVTYGSNFTLLNPTRTGYTFAGWYENDVKIESGVWQWTANKDLKAKWTANTYTYTLDVNGGNTLDNNQVTLTYNATYNLPTPTKTGHIFKGWFEGNTEFPSYGTLTVVGNKTLKAKWTPAQYSITLDVPSTLTKYYITFYPNFTTTVYSPTKVEVKSGEPIAFPKYERDGYFFAGWYTDEKCSQVFDIRNKIDNSISLYARWIIDSGNNMNMFENEEFNETASGTFREIFFVLPFNEKVHIKFSMYEHDTKNGGIIIFSLSEYYSSKGITSAEIGHDVKREGLKETLEVDIDATTSQLFQVRYIATQNNNTIPLGLKAEFTKTVFNDQNLDILNPNAQTVKLNATYGSSYSLGVPQKSNGTFVGWFTEENGSGTKVTDNLGESLAPWNFTSNQKFYPYFN